MLPVWTQSVTLNGEIVELDRCKFTMPKVPASMTLQIAYILLFFSDFAESPQTFIPNIWLSIIQFAEFVNEKNDILMSNIHPEYSDFQN